MAPSSPSRYSTARAAALVCLAALCASVSAQDTVPSGVGQELCELSGGFWSQCASPCPLTCESLTPSDDPVACPTVCVIGCQCPSGFVLDGEFGCKPESFCEPPQFCCEALTAECEACAAGVSVEQFCAVKPDFLGCPSELPSPASPPSPAVDQELCEFSGGEWSPCASACPTTCESLGKDNTVCIEICALGCVCPDGFVFDTMFGCKPESACEPVPCCQATTPQCFACQAGVPVEQFCKAKPDTEGCESIADPCSSVDCNDSQFCALVNAVCITAPCPPVAVCTSVEFQPEYNSCVSQNNEWRECLGCRSTCIDPDGTSCGSSDDDECTPGCECASGQLFDPVALICVPSDECPCEEVILGDLNGDDVVSVQDTIVLVTITLGQQELDECDFGVGNVNGDDLINVQDIVGLLALIIEGSA